MTRCTVVPTAEQPNTTDLAVSRRVIQRKCSCGQHSAGSGECEGCQKKRHRLQRQAVDHSALPLAPTTVDPVPSSPGHPLGPATRAFMESFMGHDFSGVRVHADAVATESAFMLNADAYTVGNDVIFGLRQYAPSTPQGAGLLAHELTHVMQQKSRTEAELDRTQQQSELEADCHAERVESGLHILNGAEFATPRSVQSQQFPPSAAGQRQSGVTPSYASIPADTASHGRCPSSGPCPEDPLVRHQGHGTTVCDRPSGTLSTTVNEHCGGNCVEVHEQTHVQDDRECCERVGRCISRAGGNIAAQTACDNAYSAFYTSTTDYTECNAYTAEVACLNQLISRECSGSSRSTTIGAIVGGTAGAVLGGIGGFLLGGIGGAVGGALLGGLVGTGLGAGIGRLVGGVSEACCNTIAGELTFAQGRAATHCAAATNVPCPFRADGTIIV